jgi:hypothetical protein
VGRGSLAAALAAALALGAALPAQASDTLDQSQLYMFSLQRQIPMLAQTFTAGAPGQLDRISLGADTSSSTRLRVSIQTVTAGGTPSGTALWSTDLTVSWACCRVFHDVAVNPTAGMTPGTKYALVVQTLAGSFTWYNSSTIDVYTGGRAYVGSSWLTGSQWGEDFAFETWVLGGVNQAPTVGADLGAVVVNEGTAPTNTGTYSDPDGDLVTLSASTGTWSKSGTSRGTWTWTAPATDEAPPQTVTITASDGQGHTATTSFTFTVKAVAPVATIVADPPTIPEGTAEQFVGAATTAYAGDAAGLTYAWTATKDGNAYTSGGGTAFTLTPDDQGTYVVTFTAIDDGGLSGTDSVTVLATNADPSVKITSVSTTATLVGGTIDFTGTFSDPGVLDTHSVLWEFGDGSTSTASYGAGGSADLSASHAYTSAGTFTVRLIVTDDDGGVGSATVSVTVQTPQQAMAAISGYVGKLTGLTAGQKNSLIAKLNAASAAADRGAFRACVNQLYAFLNELQAYVNTGRISAADATVLREATNTVEEALGSRGRFPEL